MAVLKCKMCGGSMQIAENISVAECEYCGSMQTVPKLDDENKITLFERANTYRANKEFDKASLMYEEILSVYPNEAEAHWGLCLCRYGIEYVTDPKSGKRVPTCNRTQYRSILDDDNYLFAVAFADIMAKSVYREEAAYIDSVQKEILEISSNEEPYDVFICYKETDEEGNRTLDSVIAFEIYSALKSVGYRVFYARITLYEEAMGKAFEPYIFAALNSARVMFVVGTKPEYFEAPWVRNEWSRYMALMETNKEKNLFPCFRNMVAEALPSEFRYLQATDTSRIGYIQDIVHGVGKILGEKKSQKSENVNPDGVNWTEPNKVVISKIVSVGTNGSDDYWPKGTVSSRFNPYEFEYVSFQSTITKPIGIKGEIPTTLKIYDEFDNIIVNDSSTVNVDVTNDTFAKMWHMRGDNNSIMQDGVYRAEITIGNSDAKTYKFAIESNGKQVTAQNNNTKTMQGAPVIESIKAYSAKNGNDVWPVGNPSTAFSKTTYGGISFQIQTREPIGKRGNIALNLRVYNSDGVLVTEDNATVNVTPDNDRFAIVWKFHWTNGKSAQNGKYRAELSIDDSLPKVMEFTVIAPQANNGGGMFGKLFGGLF